MKFQEYNYKAMKRKGANKAMALVITLIVMILLMAVVVTLSNFSQLEIKKTINHYSIMNARHSSESGISYGKYLLRTIDLGSVSSVEDVLNNLHTEMGTLLDGSPALGGQVVSRGGTGNINVIIPPMATGSGTFKIAFRPATAEEYPDETQRIKYVMMESAGTNDETTRTATIALNIVPGAGNHPILYNGVATNGTFKITGSSSIIGLNDQEEANVYMTTDEDYLLQLTGTSKIGGDVYAVNPNAYVDTGNKWQSTSIGGAYGEDIIDHVHTGVDHEDLPDIDTTAIVNSVSLTTINSHQSGVVNLSNIRIAANSNVHINGQVDLKGLIYIESPNDIKISGDVNITGMIITEASDGSSSIDIGGGNTLHPVSDLPDTAQFIPLKAFGGSAIIAPGYEVTFSGNTVSVGGLMAADNFIFKGYGNMTVKGGILVYGTGCCELKGNQTIIIDKSDMDELPPGFVVSGGTTTLNVEPETYVESY